MGLPDWPVPGEVPRSPGSRGLLLSLLATQEASSLFFHVFPRVLGWGGRRGGGLCAWEQLVVLPVLAGGCSVSVRVRAWVCARRFTADCVRTCACVLGCLSSGCWFMSLARGGVSLSSWLCLPPAPGCISNGSAVCGLTYGNLPGLQKPELMGLSWVDGDIGCSP